MRLLNSSSFMDDLMASVSGLLYLLDLFTRYWSLALLNGFLVDLVTMDFSGLSWTKFESYSPRPSDPEKESWRSRYISGWFSTSIDVLLIRNVMVNLLRVDYIVSSFKAF